MLHVQMTTVVAASACGSTRTTCGAWCEIAPRATVCVHPNASQCRDDFCCLTCDKYLRFLKPDVPRCSCVEYKAGACFASDCVPCSTECFPHNLTGLPLGQGILCTNSSATCEPCCQHHHSTQFCQLECPCDGGGADCLPSAPPPLLTLTPLLAPSLPPPPSPAPPPPPPPPQSPPPLTSRRLPIPPRLMWGWGHAVSGYCGSASLQTAALYWGNWLTQDTVRGQTGAHEMHAYMRAYPPSMHAYHHPCMHTPIHPCIQVRGQTGGHDGAHELLLSEGGCCSSTAVARLLHLNVSAWEASSTPLPQHQAFVAWLRSAIDAEEPAIFGVSE